MIDDFVLRAAAAGIGVAAAAGPLGSFVVWRRMAYFGDATAHAAILGVALALWLQIPIGAGTFAVALAMGSLVAFLIARGHSSDATLAVLAHSALALGLVLVSFQSGVRLNLEAFLFGDILTVSLAEVALIWSGATLLVALLVWRWSRLLISTLNPELAVSAGVNPRREQAVLTLALAILVAIALKVVGALLIAALLIIPAATARSLARTPEMMALSAAAVASLAALGGLAMSLWRDTPAGPSIVTVAALFFALSTLVRRAG